MNSTDKKTHQSVYYSAMKSSLKFDHWPIRRSDFLFLSKLKDEKKKRKDTKRKTGGIIVLVVCKGNFTV